MPSREFAVPGGGGGIRTLVTRVTGKTVFETAAFNHSATPPHWVRPRDFGPFGYSFEKGHVLRGLNILAERWGFEPQVRFWRTYDFQSYTFGQLGHLSAASLRLFVRLSLRILKRE